MDHVVVPLDASHANAAANLAAELGDPTTSATTSTSRWHVTLASFEGVSPATARSVVESVAARTEPFVAHAHGYGLFVGGRPDGLVLHVPVVRGPRLEALRVDLHRSLVDVGARIAPWLGPDNWSPHITLIDRVLADPDAARVVAFVLRRHHPSWQIPVGELAVSTDDTAGRRWDRVGMRAS
jgi:2'-5' RNA ligase